ncbi:copper-binding protein [Roseobacter sp. HKCCD9010]|jgi:plastocyanin|uniref:cupredoxin domain-containing protein n=1 Tax=unclassified Roseobacter TaxID=196798 RepID=UPI00119A2CFC|nr:MULTISPECIES: cupredoxin domain-containing protein [unclassified Roseobacter]MBF9050116.1 copper-binding protein [Rhodobacterales bacterium HKCCD4356]NNV12359.1 copper-binding protein [Roseobacter sp. HKCCD7357]NNV16178.1 copper-binding protein [Roseobacter sp. HKCCD8768]NNV25638.1 copper-binding protein [Roseobacter sp. HKCCD8192]NNV29894.1 copper-binding protein [Roseobacter sp. HKCCD9061]
MTISTRRQFLQLATGLLAAPALIRSAHAAGHVRLPVTIQNFAFAPADVELGAGDFVVFTNADGAPHTATANDGFFDSGRLNQGDSFEVRMTDAGEFTYFCQFHPNMTGVIRVT